MASSNPTEPEQASKTAGKADLPAVAAATNLLKAADLGLRLLLFVVTLVPLVVTVTSKQTKHIYSFEFVAKFNYTSALVCVISRLNYFIRLSFSDAFKLKIYS